MSAYADTTINVYEVIRYMIIERKEYLEGIYNTIVVKDIVNRKK